MTVQFQLFILSLANLGWDGNGILRVLVPKHLEGARLRKIVLVEGERGGGKGREEKRKEKHTPGNF